MSPTYENIGINEVVARAKVQLLLTNTSDYDNFLEMAIFEAMGSLGLLSQLVKDECPLNVTDGIADLPKNFIKLIAVRADVNVDPDSNDPITSQFSQCGILLYADTPFLTSCGCNNGADGFAFNSWNFPYQSYQINKGRIYMNCPSGTITNAKIAYYGTNVDDKGKAVIFSRYERALFNYACWQFTLAHVKDYNQYVIETYAAIYRAQRSMLQAQDVRFKFENEAREIQNILSAFVVSRAVNFINS